MEAERNPLIATIIEDARKEAVRIIAQAEKSGALQITQAEKRAAEIVESATKDGEQRLARELAQAKSSLEMERRRIELQQRAALSTHLLDLLAERFREIIPTPRYRDFLKQWLLEAVIGLERPWAEVVTSPDDPIDDALLKEVMKESSKALGYEVTVVLAAQKDPTIQGVLVFSQDRKTAYNNTVTTRMKRYATEIHRVIHRELLGVEHG